MVSAMIFDGQNCDLDGSKVIFPCISVVFSFVYVCMSFEHVLNTYQNHIAIASKSPQNRINIVSRP